MGILVLSPHGRQEAPAVLRKIFERSKKELAKKYTIKNTFRHLVEERIEKWRIFREERKAV